MQIIREISKIQSHIGKLVSQLLAMAQLLKFAALSGYGYGGVAQN